MNVLQGKQSLRQHLVQPNFSSNLRSLLSATPFRRLGFTPVLICLGLFLASCEKDDSTPIDSIGSSPFIVSALITPSSINTDTINVGTERKPEDVLQMNVKTYATVTHSEGQNKIASVTATIFSETLSSPLSSTVLLDDGNDVDSTKDDGIFSGWNTFEIVRSEIGTFRVEITSEDAQGFRSSAFILPLRIIRNNQPPALSNLQAPDTVRTSAQTSFLITVRASDPDGLADIKSVTRTTPSNLVLQLNDTGVNGDAVAGDGIFSETVSVAPPPAPGAYQFRFQAFDRSNAASNIILHTITIVP